LRYIDVANDVALLAMDFNPHANKTVVPADLSRPKSEVSDFGRPRKLALDQGEMARRLVSEGKSVREMASVFNVNPATIYRLAPI
jgi:hypothetical protein